MTSLLNRCRNLMKSLETEGSLILQGNAFIHVSLVVPPAWNRCAEGIENAEPSTVFREIRRLHRLLEKILVVLVMLTGFEDVLQGLRAQNNSDSAPRGICRLDDEGTPEPSQISERKLKFFLVIVGSDDDGVGDVDAVSQQLKVHGRFVRCPLVKLIRVDNPERTICGSVESEELMGKGMKRIIFVRCTVEHDTEMQRLLFESVQRLLEVRSLDPVRRESPALGNVFHNADEVVVVLPIPRKREVNYLCLMFQRTKGTCFRSLAQAKNVRKRASCRSRPSE